MKTITTTIVLYWLIQNSVWAQIPEGYYVTAEDKSGYELKTALYNIIRGHTVQSYNALWGHFEATDRRADGKVWDMYADCDLTFGTDQDNGTSGTSECQKFNREHSFPRSWFGGSVSPMNSDLFHLYPTDKKVNSERGNLPFGEVSNASYTSGNGSQRGSSVVAMAGYSGQVFEPADEFKGDFARTYFYMATRYENVIAGWESNSNEANATLNGTSDQVYEQWLLEILYAWHTDDPVSQKELDRNDAVYEIQDNRNPYIDHPEWVGNVWGFTSLPDIPTSLAKELTEETVLYPVPTTSKQG
ncbi:MAG: endonuclease, partial [Bacteroidota bacterium]